jgi:hypothetical protein
LERHARFLAAVAADRAEHLTLTAAVSAATATSTAATGATRGTIRRTTARRVL